MARDVIAIIVVQQQHHALLRVDERKGQLYVDPSNEAKARK
jgi:hypothetical protein